MSEKMTVYDELVARGLDRTGDGRKRDQRDDQ